MQPAFRKKPLRTFRDSPLVHLQVSPSHLGPHALTIISAGTPSMIQGVWDTDPLTVCKAFAPRICTGVTLWTMQTSLDLLQKKTPE